MPRLSALNRRDKTGAGLPQNGGIYLPKAQVEKSFTLWGEAFSASLFSNCDFLSLAAENDCLNCAAHSAYLCAVGLLYGLSFKMIGPRGGGEIFVLSSLNRKQGSRFNIISFV